MKEYVVLPPSVYDNNEEMRKWLNISYEYVFSLPLKEEKRQEIGFEQFIIVARSRFREISSATIT